MAAQRVSGSVFTSTWVGTFWMLPLLFGLWGCAQSPARSLSRAWDHAPKIKFWSLVPETVPEKGPEKVVDQDAEEPQVAANTPADHSDENASDTKQNRKSRKSDTSTKKEKALNDSDEKIARSTKSDGLPRDPFEDLEPANSRDVTKKSSPSIEEYETDEPPQVTARERLRATLSDETRRKPSPRSIAQTGHAVGQEQLRLRIESLMRRANAHCENEEWPEAKRAAELAQSLAESSRLEFDPDDERPVELLTLINARLEAKAQHLADEQVSETDPPTKIAETEAPIDAESEGSRSVKAPYDSSTSFDPYSQQVALAHLDENLRSLTPNQSMVELDTPTFEEEPEVSPTAYSRPVDRIRNRRQFSLTRQAESASPDLESEIDAELASETTEQSASSEVDEPLVPTITIPEMAEQEEEIAPAPPIEGLEGPALEPEQKLADALPAPDINRVEADETEEVRPAGAWPRWMPMSLLSILTTGFCLWYWRRRLQAAR